ncbi:nucleotidyltransferase family protein [Anaerobacillus sp. HL2]|nr:nucleotidyltransferase family protein [Anaerobacillus sp. HL2]
MDIAIQRHLHLLKRLNTNKEMLDLSLPNNILGFHYIKAIHDQAATIEPFTIERKNSHYHDKEIPSHSIASATSIVDNLVNQC